MNNATKTEIYNKEYKIIPSKESWYSHLSIGFTVEREDGCEEKIKVYISQGSLGHRDVMRFTHADAIMLSSMLSELVKEAGK